MKKAIYFDMDGTIADLYGVPNWLTMLRELDPTPYAIAKPLVNMSRLARYLNKLQKKGYAIGIVSWLSKEPDTTYDDLVTVAKKEWLQRHLPSVEWDVIYIVPHGTNKYECCGDGILFDDDERNLNDWPEDYGFTPDMIFNILKVL